MKRYISVDILEVILKEIETGLLALEKQAGLESVKKLTDTDWIQEIFTPADKS